MRNITAILAVTVTAVLSLGGCTHAAFQVRPDHFQVEGRSDNPEAMTLAAAQAYATARNTDEYWAAVREGRAYPYQGGGYGNDYWYYYRNVVPPRPAAPAESGSAGRSGDYATRDELESVRERADEAHERATDGLRMHRRLRERLTGGPAQK